MAFPDGPESKVIARHRACLPACQDLVDLFLTEAERWGMQFFFGTYDSGAHWINGDYRKETGLNRDFCSEVMDRYGHRPAFAGWYISHEINTFDAGMIRVYGDLAGYLRMLKDVPILMSPSVKGAKQPGPGAISLDRHPQAALQGGAGRRRREAHHVRVFALHEPELHVPGRPATPSALPGVVARRGPLT